MFSYPKLLKDLISKEDDVQVVDALYIAEKQYAGTYSDMSHSVEKNVIDELTNTPWRQVVKDRFFDTNPWLYKIISDPGRAQFLDLLRLPERGTYLDVGSGWGQVTIPLAKKGFGVAFDLTRNRLEILRRIAKQEGASVGCLQGNFITFPLRENIFDLIVFNGSLEWIGSGRDEDETIWDSQFKALNKAAKLLKSDGIVYVGIENSIGVKYLMGTNDDHTGISHLMYMSEKEAEKKHFDKHENKLAAKTWSLQEYYKLFDEAGLEPIKVYGCFPDYKTIRLMIELEEVNQYFRENEYNISEYDGSNGEAIGYRIELSQLYSTLALNDNAHYFCPSFGFVLKRKKG